MPPDKKRCDPKIRIAPLGIYMKALRLKCPEHFEYYFTSSNIKYIDNQLVTVIKIQMICKCKYKTI